MDYESVTFKRLPRPQHELAEQGCVWMPITHNKYTLVDADVFAALGHEPWQYNGTNVGLIRNAKSVLLHRVIMNVTDSKTLVDHRNRNILDNRRANLRIATKSQNNANSVARNASGVKGASYDQRRNLWRATITVCKKQIWLGYFATAREAGEAYDKAAREAFGEFARLNQSPSDPTGL